MSRLIGKHAIVTGGARGIGASIVRLLAAEGAKVVVNYERSKEAAEKLAAETGGVAVQANIAKIEDTSALWDAAEKSFGPVDILINNAGVAIMKPVAEATEEDFDRSFGVNAKGAFFCAREAARRMRDGGRIVSISTGATVGGTAGGALYCGSKAALEQFTRALARELGERGITVNTVSPGFTETDMFDSLPHLREIAPGMSALGRIGQPEDVADVVVWLCTEQARWITGQNIQAGGGVSMV